MKPTEFDIKNAHMHHRLRIRKAKAIIDNRPPLLMVNNHARLSKMKEDIETAVSRHKQNARLLVVLNKVLRTKGQLDTFRTAENSFTPPYSKLTQKIRLIEKLDIENMRIGRMILCAKPEMNTWLDDKFKRKIIKKKPPPFQYPAKVMSKYSHVEIPQDPLQQQYIFRPKIWFHLEIKDVRPLGRISLELYTEAAPQIVMEFVRFCFAKQTDRISFIRLFPRLWLEGNILLDSKTLIQKNNIEFDKRSLDHGEYAGVLSFNTSNFKSAAKPVINFSLSFKPLRVCNGRRVGFGRVCQGLKVLKSIEDFGNKNGKLYREIIVTSCGILK